MTGCKLIQKSWFLFYPYPVIFLHFLFVFLPTNIFSISFYSYWWRSWEVLTFIFVFKVLCFLNLYSIRFYYLQRSVIILRVHRLSLDYFMEKEKVQYYFITELDYIFYFFFATTAKRPSSWLYSQVDNVKSCSPYSAVAPVSYILAFLQLLMYSLYSVSFSAFTNW